MSHLAAAGPAAPSFRPPRSIPHGELYSYSRHKHPLNERIIGGHVAKVPMFYGPFTGSRTPALDPTGANGRLIDGRGFVFTGRMLGPIDPASAATYTFGIDRGGAAASGPFPDRPMIYYDALVTVSTGPAGAAGTVELLDGKGRIESSRPIPADVIRIQGKEVEVDIPFGQLPSTSPPGTHRPEARYFYAFWAGTSATDPHGIAGFAPEYAITRVATEGFPRS